MKKTLGYAISIPVLLFGALGNFHLYKEAGEVSGSLRNVIISITAVGVELAILFLIHSLAKSKASTTSLITGWLLAVVIPVSLIGQYSYLLKEASKKTESVEMAKGNLDMLAIDKASLIADKTALQGEKAMMLATLERESASGYGPKAQALKASIESLDSKLSAIDSKVESLGVKVEGKQAESLEVTELTVLAKEFGLDANGFMKVMVGVFLTIANVIGFWLVYLSDMGAVALPIVAATKAVKKVKRVPRVRKTKEPVVERVVLGVDELPINVIPFTRGRDMVG